MFQWFHRLAASKNFYRLAEILGPLFGVICAILLTMGLYRGLFVAPADYEQGESYRIIYVHVPSAWMSMFVYMVIATCSAFFLIWKMKLADIVAEVSASMGAAFTFLALATGSLWGKPMWGTWWEWDARLTSELILLFLYIGYMALRASIDNRATASRAAAILALVGVVNIPIIHYSVEWWNTLHQPASITKLDTPSIHISMLIPLLMMALGFTFFYLTNMLSRARSVILEREANTGWVKQRLQENRL
ncbi:heme ABC transporter permease [Chromatiales bacterium (ex Bugula neritina AB1)]|nr:heme ABC transporter permease [Chromatiales bacterium (ex Bugula neritina AB1)]